MPIYAAGPRPATMTLAPTSRRCIKHTLDRYLPLRSSTTKQRNSADPTPQIIARIASRPVSPDSSRAQISIAPARHRPTFPDRGFLPWRLSDAGRRCTWHRRVRPASETLHKSGLACSQEAALLAVCESNTNRRRDGRRSELVQDVDQLSVRWRAPFAEGLDRVGFGQAVEPGEQANALTAAKLGLG